MKRKDNIKILILDDEQAVRQALADALQSAGYSVEQVSSVEAAIAMLATRDWALILTDLLMPGTNGLSLVEFAQRDHRDVPVVMVTGVKEETTIQEAERLGVTGLIHKPLILDELEKIVLKMWFAQGTF